MCLAYAERTMVHSRSGTNGIVQEDITGIVAVAFSHWDSRAGAPHLHDHMAVWNRAKSVSDGRWRTLSRGLFKGPLRPLGYASRGTLRLSHRGAGRGLGETNPSPFGPTRMGDHRHPRDAAGVLPTGQADRTID
jgi:hypothetical protein